MVENICDCVMVVTTIVALIISYIQYRLHKQKERSILFTNLNQRYLENADIQTVVRYLSKTDPAQKKPDDYQTELFLRFFEELDVYIRSKALRPKVIEQLFGYYLRELFISDRGKDLLKICGYQKSEWPYIEDFLDAMKKVNKNDWQI